MPSGEEIHQALTGVWRMMTGRADGLKLLDLSADGFWNSFFAIVIALPPMVLGWIAFAGDAAGMTTFEMRFSVLLREFIASIGAWVLPLVLLAAAARPAGIADRFVHYVVATNWASVLFAWLMLPPVLIQFFLPAAQGMTAFLLVLLFLLSLFLSWRVTVTAIGKGPPVGTAVFFAMSLTSLLILFLLQGLLGLEV